MRIILGIILGFFLTVGIVYVADNGRHAVCPQQTQSAEGRPIVNWDEANARFKSFSDAFESFWSHLTGRG